MLHSDSKHSREQLVPKVVAAYTLRSQTAVSHSVACKKSECNVEQLNTQCCERAYTSVAEVWPNARASVRKLDLATFTVSSHGTCMFTQG